MDIELLKRMMDAFYQAKRIRDMLPPLPEGVTSSYIQYLDVIHSLNCRGIQAKCQISAMRWHFQDQVLPEPSRIWRPKAM